MITIPAIWLSKLYVVLATAECNLDQLGHLTSEDSEGIGHMASNVHTAMLDAGFDPDTGNRS